MNLNKAMLIGRLTRDPEMRYLPSGQAVTSFGIATNRYGTGPDGERKEFTDFHNISAWNQGKRNLAEICSQYLRKGALVYIEGRIQTSSWEDKQTGQKRTKTEINATDVQFLDSRSGAGAAGGDGGAGGFAHDGDFGATPGGAGAPAEAAPVAVPAAEAQDIDPDDIPF